MVYEISAKAFDSRFTPVFEHVLTKAKYPLPFSPDVFFPTWKASMEAHIARVWVTESERSILGALFTPNIFTGAPGAFAIFWFSLGGDGGGPLELLATFEAVARATRCKFIYSSSFNALKGSAMDRLYRMKGFEPSETVFRKTLE